jgi:hypothetical protein
MKKLALALIVSAAASQASAVALTMVSMETQNWDKYQVDPVTGHSTTDTSGSTATYSFDGTTLSSTGVTSMLSTAGPSTLFTNLIGDYGLVMNGAASGSSYECANGTFGPFIQFNMCASTTYGTNGIDETVVTYNIGGDASNQSTNYGLNGDDGFAGPSQSLSDFDMVTADDNAAYSLLVNGSGQLGYTTYNWDGITLVVNNLYGNTTTTTTFSAVPVPAAAWLFGSALLGLAGIKRKK